MITRPLSIAGLVLILWPAAATAGMPAPLPTNVEKAFELGGSFIQRLQAISFFLVAFLLCALVVKLLWNYIRRDFTSLPRLSYLRALAITSLWGLVFIVVLTMISGARELMTPGAWQKQDWTYRLANDPGRPSERRDEDRRRQHLEQLRTALWQFAATHEGRFPSAGETTAVPTSAWETPVGGGLRYVYVPDLKANPRSEILAYEPEFADGGRLVLKSNGDILLMQTPEIRDALAAKEKP